MNLDAAPGKVETIRWRARTRRVFGGVALVEDADGSRRMVAEGGWLAVVYSREPERAFVDTIERAEAVRAFEISNEGNGYQLYVSRLTLGSSVGTLRWEGRLGRFHTSGNPILVKADPRLAALEGTLRLPDGTTRETRPGGGIFEAPGLVRAYGAWRDADPRGGWTLIVEVDRSAPEEVRPLLAALPLLLFSAPPV